MRKKMILVARYYSIEPLGILYLAGLVRDAGWDLKVVLVREFDFEPVYYAIRDWQPDLVGFQIWTGYHLQAFPACDIVRSMGVPVVIGGPHATYFDKECGEHADWVVKGSGFGMLQDILAGTLTHGIHFNQGGREEPFPLPDRDVVYVAYPELGRSPIKSMFGSVGCPYTCTYCYAPAFNAMHGGFRLTTRPVDDLVREAQALRARWPTELIYFQDDVFGFNTKWLEEFARKWKEEVGIAFHCQIRLELTQHAIGDKRLDLLQEAGCSGITLAIESGNAFLRDHVLFRHMPDELIVEGCRKILDRGMTLRTEQILAVPFSDTATDLATLDLNNRINPTMAWTSILAPYGGTDMGTIASNFGFYVGDNNDLAETFFDRSVLRHVKGGPKDVERIAAASGANPKKDRVLLNLRAVEHDEGAARIVDSEGVVVGSLTYLSSEENDRYCRDTVRLQRLFNFLAKVPDAALLGSRLVELSESEWTWVDIGRVTYEHLEQRRAKFLSSWRESLAREMGLASSDELPEAIQKNPWFFCFFPAGGILARRAHEEGTLDIVDVEVMLDELGTMARRHLFDYGLYMTRVGPKPIAA